MPTAGPPLALVNVCTMSRQRWWSERPTSYPARSGPVDRRLLEVVPVSGPYLAAATLCGLGATALVVVQAVALATVISRALLDAGTVGGLEPELAGLAAAFAGRAVLVWAGDVAAQHASAAVVGGLRRRLVDRALELGPHWLAGQRAGELSAVATRGIAALETYFGRYLPQVVLAALAPIGILAWVASTDWISALILCALLALVPASMVFFGRRAEQESTRQWRRLASLSARFLELIQGLPTLRAFGRAANGRREVVEATESLRLATMRTLRVAFLSSLALELIAGLGTGLVAMVLGLRLLDGSVTLPVALAVLLVSPEVFLPLRRAGTEFHASAEGKAAAERILEVLSEPSPSLPPRSVLASAAVPDPARAVLQMSGVSVWFPGRPVPALSDFELSVEPGEHVALVGPSGAGKSTVLGVLLGFVRPGSGTVSIGGILQGDVDPARWRTRIGWVPQRPYLFSATLGDNVRLGDPAASPEAVLGALELAGLSDLLGRLPDGPHTPVGDGGLALSAGERQRVGLARVLLRAPGLVLMDEPAAHLDPVAEAGLGRALAPWLAGRSVIVAAHRPELLTCFDRTIWLEPARLEGTDTGASPAGAARVATGGGPE